MLYNFFITFRSDIFELIVIIAVLVPLYMINRILTWVARFMILEPLGIGLLKITTWDTENCQYGKSGIQEVSMTQVGNKNSGM